MTCFYFRFISRFKKTLLVTALLTALTACVANNTNPAKPHIPIKINFNDSHCPTSVDPNTPVNVDKAADQRIVWQSVNSSGDPESYKIFFDPFKGRPLKSDGKGEIRSPKISADSPVDVDYKYSIVGDDCNGPALDPRFHLD